MCLTRSILAHIIGKCQAPGCIFFGLAQSEGRVAEGIRLNKALADAGVCSRRAADDLVFSGQVRVNGIVADSPGVKVFPGDKLEVGGRVLRAGSAEPLCWIMLNKPVHVVSTASDPQGRTTVIDLVPEQWRGLRLYPVGRLDYFSQGLLLLTNDGELANRLTHPRWHLPKTYRVLVRPENGEGSVEEALSAMRRGMTLAEGDRLLPVECQRLPWSGRGVLLELVLRQGVNRQIRRMCRDLSLTVLRLRRIAEGPLSLGSLPEGCARPLTAAEVRALRRAAGLDAR